MALIADFVTGKPVTFKRMRHLLSRIGLQEGIYDAADLKVTQRAAGANMTVDVAAGDLLVGIDTGVRNGLAHAVNDALANVGPFAASHATLPRVDVIGVQYNDTSIPAGTGGDDPVFRIVQGTPTAGATLDNRNGAPGGAGGPAAPVDFIHLADVLIPAASTSVVTANIRDRRRWARGAFRRILRNASTTYATASTSFVVIDATNLSPRLECSGWPLRMKLNGSAWHSLSSSRVITTFRLDGVSPDGNDITTATPNIGDPTIYAPEWVTTPAAGSRLIAPYFRIAGGTGSIGQSASTPLELVVEELIRQDADNT